MHLLVDDDCVLFDAITTLDTRAATTIATRRFVVYARRPAYQAKLCEDINGVLFELADIPGAKEGSVRVVAGINELTVYTSMRAPADPFGDFKLWSHVVSVHGVWPIDYAAVVRLRAVAQIVKKHLPIAASELEPFCK